MVNTLQILQDRRKQILSVIDDNASKFLAATLHHAPLEERKALADTRLALDTELDNVNAEIKALEKSKLDEETRLLEEKRNADDQALLEKKEKAKKQWSGAKSKLKGNFADSAQMIIDTLKVQIMPSIECVEPNDAFIKCLFRFGTHSFKKALQGSRFNVLEKRQTSKKDAILSSFHIGNADGFDDDNPLDEFDRAVLGVIISEYLAGNRYTTVNIIFRALIGKVGKAFEGTKPMKNQQDAIINSVLKLMATIVDFSGAAESLIAMQYTDKNGNSVTLKSSNLLSADILDGKINGQLFDGIIFFKDNSPLFVIANAKSQVIRYPHALLDVPNQNNTPRIISIKKYVLRRISEIKLHHMTPTITFDDVFQKCRMLDSPREVKRDARNSIIHLFQHLKDKNFISDFELVRVRQKFISVKVSF